MWVYNNRERQESDGDNGLTLTQAIENVGRNK